MLKQHQILVATRHNSDFGHKRSQAARTTSWVRFDEKNCSVVNCGGVGMEGL